MSPRLLVTRRSPQKSIQQNGEVSGVIEFKLLVNNLNFSTILLRGYS